MATRGSGHNRGGGHSAAASSRAGDFLSRLQGKRVLTKLNDGTVYGGTFICMDGNLNVVLENATLFDSVD